MSTYWFWHLLFSYENVNKEEQRNNILLAHRKNPKYPLVKLLKLQNDAKSTIIDVTKVFGENLSTVSKTGLRRIESRRPWKRRKEWPALSSGAQISRFETLQASWKGRLQRCTELKKRARILTYNRGSCAWKYWWSSIACYRMMKSMSTERGTVAEILKKKTSSCRCSQMTFTLQAEWHLHRDRNHQLGNLCAFPQTTQSLLGIRQAKPQKMRKTVVSEMHFKSNSRFVARKVTKEIVQNLMEEVKQKIRQFGFAKKEAWVIIFFLSSFSSMALPFLREPHRLNVLRYTQWW